MVPPRHGSVRMELMHHKRHIRCPILVSVVMPATVAIVYKKLRPMIRKESQSMNPSSRLAERTLAGRRQRCRVLLDTMQHNASIIIRCTGFSFVKSMATPLRLGKSICHSITPSPSQKSKTLVVYYRTLISSDLKMQWYHRRMTLQSNICSKVGSDSNAEGHAIYLAGNCLPAVLP